MSGGLLGGVVEAVVGFGHALVAGDHQRGAVVVIGFAGVFQVAESLEALGKGKGLEAVGGRITQVVLQRGSKEARPKFVCARLEHSKGPNVENAKISKSVEKTLIRLADRAIAKLRRNACVAQTRVLQRSIACTSWSAFRTATTIFTPLHFCLESLWLHLCSTILAVRASREPSNG